MRVYISLGLAVVLGACTFGPSPVPDVSGSWKDEAAAFTTCGETSPVATGLELLQTGENLKGTFSLQGNPLTFAGEVKAGKVSGTAKGSGGSLTAALTPQGERLVGTFTAAEEIDCTAGGRSTTVYDVTLERR